MMDQRGFTLLEVMVAFAIGALALTALSSAALLGYSAVRISAHTQEAVSRARSRLDAVARSIHMGEQSGDDGGGFAWQAAVLPAASGDPRTGETARLVLYHIWVDVSWRMDGGQRHVRLDTMRLASTPPGS